MAEFQAHAELSVSVDQRSLSTARQQIENELGNVEVDVNTPDGNGGGGGLGTGTAAMIEIQRRTLTAQKASAEADEVTNELLRELVDVSRGQGGGGGGGAGSTLLQVQGARSVLGSAGAGAAGGIASRLLGLGGRRAFFPGLFGKGGTGPPDELGPGNDPLTSGLADLITGLTGIEQVGEGESRVPELQVPSEFPSVNVDAPQWLQGVAQGIGIDFNVNTESTVTVVDESLQNSEVNRFNQAQDQLTREQQREAESIARAEVQRFEQRLERKLGQTSSRSGGGAFAAKGNPFEG